MSLIPSWGTKILICHAVSPKKEKERKLNSNKNPGSHWHELLFKCQQTYMAAHLIWTVQERIFLSSQKVMLDSAVIDEKSVTVNILLTSVYQALTAC